MHKNTKLFSLIVAYSRNRAVGYKGGFPWPYLKKDLTHFSQVTQMTSLSHSAAELAS
jgi:dihydrofolate reductase